MSQELSVRYEVDGKELTLTPSIIANYLTNGQQVPLPEVSKFMMLCQARKLNPFIGDAYLVAYGGKANIIVSKDAFMKRAQQHERYKGISAGITLITADGQRMLHRAGSMLLKGEQLVGGWCRVYIDGYAEPMFEEVAFSEYTTGKSLWNSKPATMIRKVAIVHALREAFPDIYSGMYTSEEMGEAGEAPAPTINSVPQEVVADVIEAQEVTHYEEETSDLGEDF